MNFTAICCETGIFHEEKGVIYLIYKMLHSRDRQKTYKIELMTKKRSS